ncbi:hypothetical protein [Paenibacillus jiagnxiensis]|uniref:hypothetical protein n=1 Tax=Paenibacillus jiagnxiensis TaxID=3228926 RepID=UPI0033A0DBA4
MSQLFWSVFYCVLFRWAAMMTPGRQTRSSPRGTSGTLLVEDAGDAIEQELLQVEQVRD